MFESCWAHHSTHLQLAGRQAEGSLMASHLQGECPERAKRVEGLPTIRLKSSALSEPLRPYPDLKFCRFNLSVDDGIVVECGSSTS